MMRKILLTAAFLLSMLSGCATVPMADSKDDALAKSFPTPPAGQSGLYIYRDSVVGAALKKDIYVNGEIIGESAPQVYFYKVVPAGENVLSTESEFSDNYLSIITEPEKNYFIRNYIKLGLFVGGANLEQIEETKGKEAVLGLKRAK
ncbi:DUF2846 domain-containing protein [Photobacterium nomapromontoriensis]|uniref:DUF2846 domain-containing protein n=1 Tax=Photobacterium nomapromontoriensis TaxID=2910237 RepID=UPI003D0C75D0